MKCGVCGLQKSNEHDLICQPCIDDGWRFGSLTGDGYYWDIKKSIKTKCIICDLNETHEYSTMCQSCIDDERNK